MSVQGHIEYLEQMLSPGASFRLVPKERDSISAVISAYRKATAPVTIDCEARWGVATVKTDPQSAIVRLTERVVSLRGLWAEEMKEKMAASALAAEMKAHANQLAGDLQDHMDGNAALRAKYGARPDETMWDFLDRIHADIHAQSKAERDDEARELAKAMIVAKAADPLWALTGEEGRALYGLASDVLRGIDEAQAEKQDA